MKVPSKARQPTSSTTTPYPWWVGALLLALALGAAYANSLSLPFVFDDMNSIVENKSIRSLWPIREVLTPLTDGSAVTNRPVLNLSLALNYAVGGLAVEGYHAVNGLIHIAAALTLFGLIRSTLLLPWASVWLKSRALGLALATAFIWGLHPLHTASVTFVTQRAESLASLFLLAVLYGVYRSTTSTGRIATGWCVGTVVLCLLGIGTKETLVTAPVLGLLYDRTFVSGTFRAAWRNNRGLHVSLFLCWLPLALLMWLGDSRGGAVGFAPGVGMWESLLTQSDAIVMYLKLAFWPHPLVFDYGTSVSDMVSNPLQVLPQATFLVALAAATLWALVRRPAIGFLGAWFFVLLAPSSSVVPLIAQMRAEHRMYLPLAAVVLLVVLPARRYLSRWTWAPAVTAAALALGVATVSRNRDYASPMILWADTVAKAPLNPRAHYNLGHELAAAGDRAAAIRSYETAIRLDPASLTARTNLATLLLVEARPADALVHAQAAARINPTSSAAHTALGRALFETGDPVGAMRAFEEALRLKPDDSGTHLNLGLALARLGELERALDHLDRSTALRPDPGAFFTAGEINLKLNRLSAARGLFEAALRLRPGDPMTHFQLGGIFANERDFAAAIPHYTAAVRGMPGAVPPLYNLGFALQSVGRNEEAIACFERLVQINPADAEAREILRKLHEPGR